MSIQRRANQRNNRSGMGNRLRPTRRKRRNQHTRLQHIRPLPRHQIPRLAIHNPSQILHPHRPKRRRFHHRAMGPNAGTTEPAQTHLQQPMLSRTPAGAKDLGNLPSSILHVPPSTSTQRHPFGLRMPGIPLPPMHLRLEGSPHRAIQRTNLLLHLPQFPVSRNDAPDWRQL